MMLKLKFMWNLATLDVTNSSLDTAIFDPKEILGILYLRSMGYDKWNKEYYSKILVNTID